MRPDDLSDEGRVDALIAWEKLASWVQAQQYRVLAAIADNPVLLGGKPDKGWVREDVQADRAVLKPTRPRRRSAGNAASLIDACGRGWRNPVSHRCGRCCRRKGRRR
jgi:hypothetical protein